MANRELSIKISADLNEFRKNIKDAQKDVSSTQSRLKEMEKSLKLKFDDGKFAEAQKLCQDAIDKTAQRTESLKAKIKELESIEGGKNTTQYTELQTDLEKAKNQAIAVNKQLEKINDIKFNAPLKELSEEIDTSKKEVDALQKSLKLKFDDAKFVEAQKACQNAINNTEQKAELLKKQIKELESSGEVNTEKYAKLQTALAKNVIEAKEFKDKLKVINNTKLDNVVAAVNKLGEKLETAGKAMLPLSAAAGALVGGLGALAIKTASTGAEIDDLSQRFGVSAQKIQEWQYIALQTGVSTETLNKAFIKARAAMADLTAGTMNNASKDLQALGISINSFDSNEDMFDGIIDALSKMDDKTLQAAYANEIFGDNIANEMLPLLNSSTEDLQKLKDEFGSMSSLSNEQVAALATLDDTLNKLRENLKYIALQIGSSLAPLIQEMAEYINNNVVPVLQRLVDWFSSLSLHQQKMIAKILLITVALAPTLLLLGKLSQGMGGIISLVGQLHNGLNLLASNPIALAIAALVAVLAILYTQSAAFRDIIAQIFSMLTPFLDILSGLFSILQPLLDLALIPISAVLSALEIPIRVLAQLLEPLTMLFQAFGNVVKGVFKGVIVVINFVLGFVQDAINFVIKIINVMISGINTALGWMGVHIGKISEVNLKINTDTLDNINGGNGNENNNNNSGNAYDNINTTGLAGNTYNDNSTTNKEQNIHITINTYGEDIDVDDLVKQINAKMAEAM